MSLRYLNLLFAVVIAIAGWGTIEVAKSVDRFTPKTIKHLYSEVCSEAFFLEDLYQGACKAINALFKTKKRIAADLRETGIALRLWGSLYGLVFLFWEAGLFIRKKKLRKNELLDQAPDEVDDA